MSFRSYEIPEGFNKIPGEVSLFIFSFLEPKDLCSLAQASKWFRYYAEKDELWENHTKEILNCRDDEEVTTGWKLHYMLLRRMTIKISKMVLKLDNNNFEQVLPLLVIATDDWEAALVCCLDHNEFTLDLNKPIFNGDFLIHWAVKKGSLVLTEWSIEKLNMDIGMGDDNGDTAIHLAARCNNHMLIEFMMDNKIERGLEVANLGNKEGRTPLHIAARLGHHKVIETLLLRGADSNMRALDGRTPLLEAAVAGKEHSIKVLVRNGANMKVKSKRGYSPLHEACERGKTGAARTLISLGCKVDSTTPITLFTPLHLAAKNGRTEVCKLLIRKGADPFALCAQGKTPIQYAMDAGEMVTAQEIQSMTKGKTNNEGCLLS